MEKNAETKKIIITVVAAIVVLALALLWYARLTPRPQEDQLLKSVTAPAGEAPQVPKETIGSVTAPKAGKPASENVMQSLTAPAAK